MDEASVLWLTGLSGAGKSTIARHLRACLVGRGAAVAVLDGDEIRRGLSQGLGFSDVDRRENIRRIAEMARLLSTQGIVVIVAAIAPLSRHRGLARNIIGAPYREVYVKASLSDCERRDVKGLYARARRGEVVKFTGVTDTYEPPLNPDLLVDTSTHGVHVAVSSLMALLERCQAKQTVRQLA
ncbi:adenylyl-sulfate kinase [Variovorax ureilyticus]|uniref:adenylyl-sulfate kinase n=1 Tax=Variovorax ureilyticus TaxID=1836198 RepID=UPI003D6734AB